MSTNDEYEEAIAMTRIGVLGGIGPESTGIFYLKLISKLQETNAIKKNNDYPQIIINSIPGPEFPVEGSQQAIPFERIDPIYLASVKELDRIGVDFIVMVCNTIHIYYNELQAAIKTPILDLREEMKKHLTKIGAKSFLIVGTPWTIKRGLYSFAGFREIRPNDDEIKQLDNAIHDFNRGMDKAKQIQTSRRICEKYLREGVDVVVLGCTEFAVMLDGADIPTANSIDILAEATVNRLRPLRIEPTLL